jgi:hypothetical protein
MTVFTNCASRSKRPVPFALTIASIRTGVRTTNSSAGVDGIRAPCLGRYPCTDLIAKVHVVDYQSALRKSLQCASRARRLPRNKRPLTARQKRRTISRQPLWHCSANCVKCFDWHGFQQKLLIAVGDGSSNPDRRSCNPLVWFPK